MSTTRDVLKFRAAAAATGIVATECEWTSASLADPVESPALFGTGDVSPAVAGDTAVIVNIGGQLQAVQPLSFYARLPLPLGADVYVWGYYIRPAVLGADSVAISVEDPADPAAESCDTDRMTLTPIVRQYITLDEGTYRTPTADRPEPVMNPATGQTTRRKSVCAAPPTVRLAETESDAPAGGLTPEMARRIVLVEVEKSAGLVQQVLVNNTKWDGLCGQRSAPVGPTAFSGGLVNDAVGSAGTGPDEIWESCNLMEDAHHIHLVRFQQVRRHGLGADAFRTLHDTLFPGASYPCAIGDEGVVAARRAAMGAEVHLSGVVPPRPADASYVFSTRSHLGNTSLGARRQGCFAQDTSEDLIWDDDLPGGNAYQASPSRFDSAEGPAYVWHCHIVSRQDSQTGFPFKNRP